MTDCEHEPQGYLTNIKDLFGKFVRIDIPVKCHKCGAEIQIKWVSK